MHRIVENARKTVPDIDELRELNIMLRKHKLTVFDVCRSVKFAEKLNNYGIDFEDMENYVQLTERFLLEKSLQEDFVYYAMKLVKLEQACGKSYKEIVDDFDKKTGELVRLENRITENEKRNQELDDNARKREEHLAGLNSEIKDATSARDGLLEIGVVKLAKLVNFIKEFESLGFNVRELAKLACALQELRKMGVDPDNLYRFIAEKGPLEAQNTTLKLDNENLRYENAALTQVNKSLRQENPVLGLLDHAWKTGTFTIFCRMCGEPLVVPFSSREYFQSIMDSGHVLRVWCPRCGFVFVDPMDIVLQIGWSLLPAREKEQNGERER